MKHIGEVFQSSEGDNLQQILDRLGDRINNDPRTSGPEPTPEPKTTAKIIQIPLWPEPNRGVPNSILRGALFPAIQSRYRRKGLMRELLAAQEGIEIRFTGTELDQVHLDVWELALHMARLNPLGTYCRFTAYSFLKALGRNTGGSQHEQLKNEFAGLGSSFVEITYEKRTYADNLLAYTLDETTLEYILWPNPKFAILYDSGWTATSWSERIQLRGKPLASWLHGFYASHAAPFPMTVEYLHRLSGSRTKAMRFFKRKLIEAHKELESVGAINGFEIDGNLVTVDRVPSLTQRKHLKKVGPISK